MSAESAKNEPAKEKRPIAILRDRHGGMSAEMKDYYKRFNETRKRLSGELQSGPKTVPELAVATGVPSHEVLWHVMAMKKYSEVVEDAQRGDYYAYKLAGEE
jgi:hypothetical protein